MRSFAGEQWSPAGTRWITQIPLLPAAQDLGDAYMASAHAWWERTTGGQAGDVLRAVDRAFRHITLSLVDIPAADVPPEQVDQLRAALARRLADLAPFALRFGPAILNTVAIELYIEPSPALTELHTRVAGAYRATFPGIPPAPVGKTYRGHSAIAYCVTDFTDEGLTSALLRTPGPAAGYLGPATMVADHVVLAPTDAWSPTGMWWDQDRALELRFGDPRP